MSPEQTHRPRHALELDRTDVHEVDPVLRAGVSYRLADQHLAGPRVIGDARAEVDGLTEVIACLEQDRPGVEADVMPSVVSHHTSPDPAAPNVTGGAAAGTGFGGSGAFAAGAAAAPAGLLWANEPRAAGTGPARPVRAEPGPVAAAG